MGMNHSFGPFYPSDLQDAVNHAERLAELVARLRLPSHEGAATAWLVGRADEIETVVTLVAREWTSKDASESSAARTLRGYLATLHVGMALHFPRAPLSCCAADFATTALPAAAMDATLESPRYAFAPFRVDDTTTEVDASVLLAALPTSTST